MDQPPIIDPPVLHPPMMPGPVVQPRSTWPTVLGVFAIVFGAAATLQGLWGVIFPLIMPSISGFSNTTGGADMFAAIEQWRPWLLLVNSATVLVAILLLFGGVMLTMRRPSSRGMLLIWAVVKIVLVCLSSYVGYHISQAQFAAMAQTNATFSGQLGSMSSLFSMVGVAVGVLWGWALPVFMLIWFTRRKIRNETAAWV